MFFCRCLKHGNQQFWNIRITTSSILGPSIPICLKPTTKTTCFFLSYRFDPKIRYHVWRNGDGWFYTPLNQYLTIIKPPVFVDYMNQNSNFWPRTRVCLKIWNTQKMMAKKGRVRHEKIAGHSFFCGKSQFQTDPTIISTSVVLSHEMSIYEYPIILYWLKHVTTS